MMKFISSPFAICVLVMGSLAFVGCGDNQTTNKQNAPTLEDGAKQMSKDEMDAFLKDREAALKQIFFSIPAPIEMADMIKDAGYTYNKEVLNSVDKVGNYIDEESRSINLGIYAADLSYATVFDQKQESVNYLAVTKSLAAALGIEGAIDEKFMTRVQNNQNNKDSLMTYVTLAYQNVNAYLKEGQRTDVSALMIAGAWVETLFLSTQYAGKNGEKEMRQRVAEQIYSLDQLINYMNLFGSSQRVNNMKADLEKMKAIYSEITVEKGETTVTNNGNGTTTIGSTEKVTMSDATLVKIAAEIKTIRNKYIQ
jgi:hypothetical protein